MFRRGRRFPRATQRGRGPGTGHQVSVRGYVREAVRPSPRSETVPPKSITGQDDAKETNINTYQAKKRKNERKKKKYLSLGNKKCRNDRRRGCTDLVTIDKLCRKSSNIELVSNQRFKDFFVLSGNSGSRSTQPAARRRVASLRRGCLTQCHCEWQWLMCNNRVSGLWSGRPPNNVLCVNFN